MMVSVEAFNARYGDALLLHYGTAGNPRFVLCDGGPSGVYGSAVKPRLAAIRAAHGTGGPLPVDLVVVSHLDDDHIHGVADMFGELAEAAELRQEPPLSVRQLWLNQFADTR